MLNLVKILKGSIFYFILKPSAMIVHVKFGSNFKSFGFLLNFENIPVSNLNKSFARRETVLCFRMKPIIIIILMFIYETTLKVTNLQCHFLYIIKSKL